MIIFSSPFLFNFTFFGLFVSLLALCFVSIPMFDLCIKLRSLVVVSPLDGQLILFRP